MITATSVYTANLHRSLPVFTATITAASIYTAAMEAGAQMEAAVRRRGLWLRWRRVRRSTQQILPFPRPFLCPLFVCTMVLVLDWAIAFCYEEFQISRACEMEVGESIGARSGIRPVHTHTHIARNGLLFEAEPVQ